MAETADRDERLFAVIEELATQLREGRIPDLYRASESHPDLAEDLRELWGAVLVAEEAARTTHTRIVRPPNAPGNEDLDLDDVPSRVATLDALPRSFGDYEIIREIGRGGMGLVYEARQSSLDRRVALKVLLRGTMASDADLARFRAEAESAARLDHPHIVPLFEVGAHEGRPFFTMRFIEGTTLAERLREGPLPPRDAARLLVDICRAVHHAHGSGVLHRDLKPSNILIDKNGEAYVSDFGLAKRIEGTENDESLTQSGAIVGTPAYMAPEQAAGSRGQVGPLSDVYSLGALLYHTLTGRPPFQAATPVDTILAVLEQDPLPPRLLNNALDRELEMIVLKTLQKPPELRYDSAEALASDLDAYLKGSELSLHSASIRLLVNRFFRETHHAGVLENWGLLWMWHSLVLLVLCVITNTFQWYGLDNPLSYVSLWGIGSGAWAWVFWSVRRRAGPITFVERQIAHVWAASVAGSTALFVIEVLLGMPVLTLSPVLGIISATVFLVKAGILTGAFYVHAAVLFATGLLMAWLQHLGHEFGLTIFGIVSAATFFIPGLKYHRQRKRQAAVASRRRT